MGSSPRVKHDTEQEGERVQGASDFDWEGNSHCQGMARHLSPSARAPRLIKGTLRPQGYRALGHKLHCMIHCCHALIISHTSPMEVSGRHPLKERYQRPSFVATCAYLERRPRIGNPSGVLIYQAHPILSASMLCYHGTPCPKPWLY